MSSKRLRGIAFTGTAILCLSVATAPFAQDKPNCRDGGCFSGGETTCMTSNGSPPRVVLEMT